VRFNLLVLAGLTLVAACMSCSSASSQSPASDPAAPAGAEVSAVKNSETAWGDDMAYGYMPEKDADTKSAMAVVSATLKSGQKAYARYSVGNLGFVEVRTSAPAGARDVSGSSQHIAVILGPTPRLVKLPDETLFEHFVKNIRPNPDKLKLTRRVKTALLLATGSGDFIDEPEALEPTWLDEGGTLTIRYHQYVGGGGMVRPLQTECTLTVNADQAFTHICGEPSPE